MYICLAVAAVVACSSFAVQCPLWGARSSIQVCGVSMQENKVQGSSQTQRDLYYQVKSSLFSTPVPVANGATSIAVCVCKFSFLSTATSCTCALELLAAVHHVTWTRWLVVLRYMVGPLLSGKAASGFLEAQPF